MLKINFTDGAGNTTKTYTAIGMKMGLVDNLMDLAEKQRISQIGQPTLAEQREIWDEMGSLIVEVFGRQFTYDQLKDGADVKEVMRCFDSLAEFVAESVRKN